jgi:hypothetical protein
MSIRPRLFDYAPRAAAATSDITRAPSRMGLARRRVNWKFKSRVIGSVRGRFDSLLKYAATSRKESAHG